MTTGQIIGLSVGLTVGVTIITVIVLKLTVFANSVSASSSVGGAADSLTVEVFGKSQWFMAIIIPKYHTTIFYLAFLYEW